MYEEAKRRYASFGVDTEKAIDILSSVPISINCWQGDDVRGFEKGAGELSGGIQATGNYPGAARNAEELMQDFKKVLSLVPGTKRLNLHASYLITGRDVGRDSIEPEDYKPWVDYAKELGIGLDFNPTLFSSPMVKENLTVSSPDKETRDYWVRHCVQSRKVAAYFAKELDTHCVCNFWIPDGYKDVPADRLGPRKRLTAALDEIYAESYPGVIDSLESKVFGIGLESFTVGSNEFYLGYAASHRDKVTLLLDAGHYHPLEYISEKLSALLCVFDKIPLHVSRPVRWDSDHVIKLDDEVKEIAKEIVFSDALDRVLIGLDYFDASINRIVAWTVGVRNMQKALLIALLSPKEEMKKLQDSYDFTRLFALTEELNSLPWSEVWDEYLRREGVKGDMHWFDDVMQYEKDVLLKRV